jgi:hypothetical protein
MRPPYHLPENGEELEANPEFTIRMKCDSRASRKDHLLDPPIADVLLFYDFVLRPAKFVSSPYLIVDRFTRPGSGVTGTDEVNS